QLRRHHLGTDPVGHLDAAQRMAVLDGYDVKADRLPGFITPIGPVGGDTDLNSADAVLRGERNDGKKGEKGESKHDLTRYRSRLDTCIPSVSSVRSPGPQPFAEPFQTIGNGKTGDVLDALIAKLPRHAQSKRSTEWNGKLAAIHTERDKSLRVQCIGHIDAFPPACLNRTVDNVSSLGQRPYQVQDVREGHA